MEEDLPLEKIGISGPILASILERFSSSQGDVDGLLFGEITHSTPSNLLDDDDLPTSTLVATITGFFCSGALFSFYDPLGQINAAALQRSLAPDRHLIGWFLGRRTTPLRPSMRESSVTASLTKTLTLALANQFPPSVFLLLSTPLTDQLIHTHEYRAFQFRHSTRVFDPKTVDVINIGPAFRAHYGAFTPNSPFPLLRPKHKMPAVDEDKETLVSLKRTAKEQQGLDFCADGFQVARLTNLMGKEAANYTSDLEDLYAKMLAKLEGLARLVEKSSAMVNDQEHRNMKLRNKFSGLE